MLPSTTYLIPHCGCVKVEIQLSALLLWAVLQMWSSRVWLCTLAGYVGCGLSCSVCGMKVLPTLPRLTGTARVSG